MTGTTRVPARGLELQAAGVTPAVVDVFDAAALLDAVLAARPDVIVHQLTDLPRGLPPERMAEAIERNARIRREGTANLVQAAVHARVARIVAQSIAWAYAASPAPVTEDSPLDAAATGLRSVTVGGVVALERLVTSTPEIAGLVLRYGRLYGPGTGADAPGEAPTVHVDAAASAAVQALTRWAAGAYNVVDDGSPISNLKARRELAWDPAFRR